LPTALHDPADRRRIVGHVVEAAPEDADRALSVAVAAQRAWAARPVAERAACLDRLGDLLEGERNELVALLVREAGKTIPDALAEVREAVDFCRYYAARAREDFEPKLMPGPTGERNELRLTGRGVFVCISPWNFPLAIFLGQVAAALVAGNAVIAKPAEQTPLIAAHATALAHRAGVPAEVLHLLPGDGASVGGRLVADRRVAGVAFTGSTETAQRIGLTLMQRGGPMVPFIAETGGQNAMIVDNSALPEQVVDDVVTSAFRSTGQRCSALRVLFLQDGIADRVLRMLKGAAQELVVGDPGRLATDVGPAIDAEAVATLEAHARRMAGEGHPLFQGVVGGDCAHGSFFAPCAFEIDTIGRLEREVFGPVLHVVRYRHDRLDAVIDAIAATGYGLTLGIHSRIERTARLIHERLPVGNTYINRNMIGAVVGVQPFGGEGLSGTGPKAGGPHYLYRFGVERTLTINTTAAGGNALLVSMADEGV
ncbi:MAG TPA: bifunctional proline dehydrogenase/L-glutamate gamma-semialdehyde dehydrogenase PutA, partial [Azospirillaceae bacterium]|nr:bifunctional proline dehydrogenase/L-glutamate gamma-semialdehyde dehydrogenase PutA [Azospirillaceae bacterium]